MGKLDGRTALVTGASRGIGEHCARALDAEGARVVLAARSVADMESVAAELTDAIVLESDLLLDGAAADLATRAIAATDGIDILVNNAGISDRQGNEHQVLQINYHAPMQLTVALAESMADRGNGSVIYVSSIAGSMGVAEIPTYGASKAAVDSLTRSQAAEYGMSGIRVNAVAPGLIITDMWEQGRQVPGLADGLERHIPLGRWGTPDEIGSVVAFLAGDDARYVTGQTITVDGGFERSAAWGHFI